MTKEEADRSEHMERAEQTDRTDRTERAERTETAGGTRRHVRSGTSDAKARGRGPWREAWQRFRGDRLSLAAFVFLVLVALVAILAPLVAGTRPVVCRYKGSIYFPILEYYWRGGENPVFRREGFREDFPASLAAKDPDSWAIWPIVYQDPYRRVRPGERPGDAGNGVLSPPSARHLFGTDAGAVDVFARVVFGTRLALLVGIGGMAVAGAIGIVLGALAGFFGGAVDVVVSRLIELMMAIPTLVLVLALVAVVENPGPLHLAAVIGLTRWESIARYTRGEFLRLAGADFVLAVRGLGAAWPRIVFSHILPNALAPAIVTIAFGVANAILLESALSFLGLSSTVDSPSWGKTLQGWMDHRGAWWLAVFPGLAIFASVFAYNLVGEGLQTVLDPRAHRRGASRA
jgi:peptide/nickel transport system permease protein